MTVTAPVGVRICPGTAYVLPKQTKQFTAIIINSESQAVTWSGTPAGAGSVGPASGLYIAPSSIIAQQQVAITPTSQTGSANGLLGTGVIILVPPTTSRWSKRRMQTASR
jgi:hypothetical protein